jgi:hypothetical protein
MVPRWLKISEFHLRQFIRYKYSKKVLKIKMATDALLRSQIGFDDFRIVQQFHAGSG